MDTQHATVAGLGAGGTDTFAVLGHVTSEGGGGNSNENATNNQENAARQKFFKEIAALMPNVDEIHVTGTGQAQEQFIHFLAATPQYKNAAATESTSNKMSDAHLMAYFDERFK
jgi:stalled ribosome rescue protein Dom34